MARYEAGETLASIAKTYDCSPPAISYVVSRSRARPAAAVASPAAPVASAAEPQLIKSASVAADSLAGVNGRTAPSLASAIVAPPANGSPVRPTAGSEISVERPGDNWLREANSFGRNGSSVPTPPRHVTPPVPPTPAYSGQANGDQRPKLHLSLGNSSAVGNSSGDGSHAGGGAQPTDSQPTERQHQPAYQQHRDAPAAPVPQHGAGMPDHARPIAAAATLFEPARAASTVAPAHHDAHHAAPKEGAGSFIDRELRIRVDGDIAAFLAAFDAALVQDTQENRTALREATDRLLRAGARTRIELERLEARIPLPRRDGGMQSESGWRQR